MQSTMKSQQHKESPPAPHHKEHSPASHHKGKTESMLHQIQRVAQQKNGVHHAPVAAIRRPILVFK